MSTGQSSSEASEASAYTPAETPIRHGPGETSSLWFERRDSSSTPSSISPTSGPNRSVSPDRNSEDIEDVPKDEGLRPFDPRRFTPTLHASLVGEILNLRREAESKSKSIDILERSLDECRTENEDLTASLSHSSKETRSLKHQLKLLEGGSSSALTELAKERDDALENISDIRKKLEQSQKKARSREEDIERTQSFWDRERESWDNERRNLERKVHVVENRLKTVLNELAAQAARSNSTNETPRAESNEHLANHIKDNSDTASIYSSSQGRRRASMTSISSDEGDMHNIRYSVASLANIQNKSDNSLNLAQELEFSDDEEFVTLDDDSISDSPGALPEEARPASAHSQMSHIVGMKARKILGLGLESNRGSTDGDAAQESIKSPSKIPLPASPHVYRDVGTQYSPPPPPKAQSLPAVKDSQAKDSSTLTLTIDMVSASCQTVGDLPSPPYTPKLPESPTSSPQSLPVQLTMVSAFTQTESVPSGLPQTQKKNSLSPQDALSPGMEVPTITIHPPLSEPPSPRSSVVLPPQTKSASCQTTTQPIQGNSIAIQTEEIRIDQRPVKLPASLLPSAIPDIPLRNEARVTQSQPYRMPMPRASKEEKRPQPQPQRKPMPSAERRPSDSSERPLGRIQVYPGNNDNGPLSKGSTPGMRRPPRTSSLFAGFEDLSDEENFDKKMDMFSDNELMNRPTATYTLRRGKMVSTQHHPSLDNTTLPEIEEHLSDAKMQLESSVNNDGTESIVSSHRKGSAARQQDIRRAAMITNSAAAHQKKRVHSASDPSTDSASTTSVAPPFPVPIRHSSRGFPTTCSDGRDSPTPSYNSRNFSDRPRPPINRKPTLRRVRSATTVSQGSQPDVFGSFSSPGVSNSSADSPRRPSLPFDDIIEDQPHPAQRRQSIWRDVAYGGVNSVNRGNGGGSGSGSGSGSVFDRERQDSTATSIQQTSVVDAIAQTMIGEWMFKYVRRKSFGNSSEPKENWEGRNADEVSASITNSGVRHKRWVWLAPYERAIIWSSKQPTSGPALLGKSGRKFTIQSVLDVKDDNPLPKGSSPASQFNRSILVLTPQRALKFTATSMERHYVWLTALSFLSHSSMDLDEIANLPPIPQAQANASPASTGSIRKNPIRESFKAAKFPRAYPKRPFANNNKPAPVPEDPMDDNDSMFDAAAPPTVPMFSSKHNRKRSNTGPRMPPPSSMRNFSAMGPASNNNSFDAIYPPSIPTNGPNSTRTSISRRTSETSGPSSSVAGSATSNFFDAIGTVRMEAFIDQTDANRPPRGSSRQGQRHRRKPSSSQWSSGLSSGYGYPQPRGSFETSGSRFEDPFKGF
ncbi:putative nuclear migration protein [Aspergillus glaucus CBS 516.65]|uniref:Pleckstrin homology domain-containing protein n=1 Tax=Aspergillus glaucus CBS 516.65 TaxID=1160497 RepID=A0A1L9VM17_ASPGL|nr:hypothetical protein ASPGLDRAFT_124940 [Aspergillus glaucus CBS 516.65]OJJ84966.1 hypothetical protein ASPGLDRAFT_124940 [Aspergillus glaucus CBS 516.65]